MKKLSMNLPMLVLTSTLSLSAYAGNEGGGGGGICTPTRCMTLAQAGLRIDSAKTEEFELSSEVVTEVTSIIKKLPFQIFSRNYLLEFAVGNKDTFVVVDQSQERTFKKFKEEYYRILNESGFSTKNFELLAVTSKSKTYLLPGFEHLDTRGKALILIHEMLIRNWKATVPQALSFDGKLVDFLAAVENGTLKDYDTWPMISLLSEIGVLTGYEVNLNYIKLVFEQNNNRMAFDDLFDVNPRTTALAKKYYIPRVKALQLRKYHQDFAKKLSDAEFDVYEIDSSDTNVFPDIRRQVITMCKTDRRVSGSVVLLEGNDIGLFLARLNCN